MKKELADSLQPPKDFCWFSWISQILALLILLLAPFTWSYLTSVGGLLIRAVDVLLMLLIMASIMCGRMSRVPLAIPVLFFALIGTLFLRVIVHGDVLSAISAFKIAYYLVGSLALVSALSDLISFKSNRVILAGLLIALPVFLIFIMRVIEIVDSDPSPSPYFPNNDFIFLVQEQLFAQNLFFTSDVLQTRGVSFRNSAGIAFFVVALFFYLLEGSLSRAVMILLMIIAALSFSRSVWLLQSLLLFLVFVRARSSNKSFLVFAILIFGGAMVCIPSISDAIGERLASNLGRFELIRVAISEFSNHIFLGREQDLSFQVSDHKIKVVHNVPIAIAVKTGIFGFAIALAIQGVFVFHVITNFLNYLIEEGSNQRARIAMIIVCFILFFRPMISGSVDSYFAIGEWGALAMFFVLFRKLSGNPLYR